MNLQLFLLQKTGEKMSKKKTFWHMVRFLLLFTGGFCFAGILIPARVFALSDVEVLSRLQQTFKTDAQEKISRSDRAKSTLLNRLGLPPETEIDGLDDMSDDVFALMVYESGMTGLVKDVGFIDFGKVSQTLKNNLKNNKSKVSVLKVKTGEAFSLGKHSYVIVSPNQQPNQLSASNTLLLHFVSGDTKKTLDIGEKRSFITVDGQIVRVFKQTEEAGK